MSTPRIKSLAEVARGTNEGDEFWYCLADFLDGFYPKPTGAAIHEEPEKISSYNDSYLAAVANDCCRRYHSVLPRWCLASKNAF